MGAWKEYGLQRVVPELTICCLPTTMFFVKASEASGIAQKSILDQYEEASGQRINVDKSSITFSRKAHATLKMLLKGKLLIQKEGGVGKYLGLPEHFGRKKRDLFTSIVDRIGQKARGWLNRFLSSAGKITMLQSVLNPIPSFAMTCFKLPCSLCSRIQSAVTRFWWDQSDRTCKMAWVPWDKMTKPKGQWGLEFRDFQNYNDDFLAKLGWRLMNCPTCLLGRVLMGKYCKASSILKVKDSGSESHGWHSILIGRDLLKTNLGWTVGNRETISVWNDDWLDCSSQLRPMGPAPEALQSLKVVNLLLPDRSDWDRAKIHQHLPFYEEHILAIKPSRTGAPDKLVWLKTSTGDYTMKTGYASACENDDEAPASPETNFDWTGGIWKLHTAPKIEVFLWKAAKGALPVSERLITRNINVEFSCSRCGQIEYINHLLFHCEFAHKVWSLAPFTTTFDRRGLIDLLSSWMDFMKLNCVRPTGIVTGQLSPWIMWSIWIARNNLIFNKKKATAPEEVITKFVLAAKEWLNEQSKDTIMTKRNPNPVALHTGINKIQTDATWRADTRIAGLGWTVQREEGTNHFEAHCFYVASPLVPEALSLREAIIKCNSLGFQNLQCESDSSQLIKALKPGSPPPEIYGITADILALSSVFEQISFCMDST